MRIVTGDMFTGRCDVLLVTTNAVVRNDGRLVMGRGAARTAVLKYPKCDLVFGSMVRDFGPNYGVLYYAPKPDLRLGIFQVKQHWADKADLHLIQRSVDVLRSTCTNLWKNRSVRLNFPGIGNGRLTEEQVLPLLRDLPDNVTIWKWAPPV